MIDVADLSVTYPGGVQALKRTSVRFVPGEFTVLLGPSGAGKSTLLRALNGLVAPTAGRVSVDGIGDIAGRRRLIQHRRRTGMIFQQHQLIGRETVLANVLMGRLAYHHPLRTLLPLSQGERRRALAAIERVQLLDMALRRADELSGGQQQRVGIARALVQEPALLLADEPVASLDPATAERVLDLLHDICKTDGLTAVISLHQLGFARNYADRIIALARGAIVFDGKPRQLDDATIRRIYGIAEVTADLDKHEPPSDQSLLTGTYA